MRRAALSYLGIPVLLFIVPLAVLAASWRRAPFARAHAAHALNISLACLLYGVCALIVGAMLALDSLQVALAVAVALLAAVWLVTLVVTVRAARAASHGQWAEIPRWLQVTSSRRPGRVR
jgi:uncharacterized Tic20 family protein